MAHIRTDIRNALKAKLLFVTNAEDRVYVNRAYDIEKAKLPAIHIYDESETISDRVLNVQRLIRKVTMKIDLLVTNSSDVDTDLDDLSKQVEDIISADRRISNTCSASFYVGMETSFDRGEKTVGRATLTYEITYLT